MTAEIKAKTANSKSFTKITSVFLSKRLKLPRVSQALVLSKTKALPNLYLQTFKLLFLECKLW